MKNNKKTFFTIIVFLLIILISSDSYSLNFKKYVGSWAIWRQYGKTTFGIGVTWTFGYKVVINTDTTYRLTTYSTQSKIAKLFGNTESQKFETGKCEIRKGKVYLISHVPDMYYCKLDDDEMEFYINGKEFEEQLVNLKTSELSEKDLFIHKFENNWKEEGIEYNVSIQFFKNDSYKYTYWDEKTNNKVISEGKWEYLKSGSARILDGTISNYYIDMDYEKNIFFFDCNDNNMFKFYLED
jgi:hypothetical protein